MDGMLTFLHETGNGAPAKNVVELGEDREVAVRRCDSKKGKINPTAVNRQRAAGNDGLKSG